MSLAIGVDIGGTKIAAGVVNESGIVVADSVRETPAADAAQLTKVVADLVKELRAAHEVVAIGIGAAGFVDAERATILFAPNIAWAHEPLAANVSALVELPVVVENDANAAAWGEFRFGAGHDAHDLLLVTVGTGIGGGLVHRGAVYRGGHGIASEVGHLRIVPDGVACGCGQRGCWEQYASGSALERIAEERLQADDVMAAPLRSRVALDGEVRGQAITELARDGDPMCVALLAEIGTWLGEGIASLATILDPRVIAIGGGVAEAGALLLDPARDAFARSLPAAGNRPNAELRLAALGARAGLVGAADLARMG